MSEIQKGIISSIEAQPLDKNGDCTRARVLPASQPDMPTKPLTIPWHLRGAMGELKAGDTVVFALFNDLSGVILERMDGEWSGIIPGSVTVTENFEAMENISAKDVTTEKVASQNSHIHGNGNQGQDTTPPKG